MFVLLFQLAHARYPPRRLVTKISIPARLEILIQGKIQAKDISQVGMISAGHADIVLDIYKDYT